MNEFAVIFDMDGVIVDTNPFHKEALIDFCKAHGFDLSEEQLIKKIYGRTNKDWIPNLFDLPLTKEQISEYGEEKEQMFRDIYEGHVEPVEGLPAFLERLASNNIPRAIATSAPRSNVDFILDHTQLWDYYPVILDESFVEKGKPDPEIYVKTAKALQFAPERCVVIEDSLSGVASAKAAGTKVVGITTTHTKEELSECDLVIDNFHQLTLGVLQKLMKTID